MRILMWNPIYVLGGGMHLMLNIVKQLNDNPRVESVTVALNKTYEAFEECCWGGKVRRVFIAANANVSDYASNHDVIYVTWPHGLAPLRSQLPKVCIFQDTIAFDAYGALSTRNYLTEMGNSVLQTLRHYSRVIVTSHYTKRRLVELFGKEFEERLDVLPHIASDPEALQATADSRAGGHPARTITAAFGNRSFLLYPANVSEHKNHVGLFHSLAMRKRKDIPLVLCGFRTERIGKTDLDDCSYVNRLNQVILNRGIQSGIDYLSLGYVEDSDMPWLWERALGLVMPTRAEGMGLPIHEAIDRRVPVIASDIEVLREHFADRSKAILWVDQECPSQLAAAWDHVCDRQAEMKELAAANSGSSASWSDIVSMTVAILERAQSEDREFIQGSRLTRMVSNVKRMLRTD